MLHHGARKGPRKVYADRLKIGYVLAEFPSPSETFIANEIAKLAELGAELTVLALRRGQGGTPAPCEVIYCDDGPPARSSALIREAWSLVREAWRLEGRWPAAFLRGARNIPCCRRFVAAVQARGIQHLHAHFAFTPADLALMIGRVVGLSVSFSAHARDIYALGRTLRRKIERADACITCTTANLRHLRSLVSPEHAEKIHAVYHGTDLDRFAFNARQDVHTPPRILAVGRLVEKKGFATLLRACRALQEHTVFECRIVGWGPLRRRLERLAAELDLQGLVCFAGRAEYEAMPELYRWADVLAVPSVIAEDGDVDGLPNVVVEALASGLPVVASDISGIPEAISHERTGLLVTPGDACALAEALRRMLNDSELRRRLSREGRELAEESFDVTGNTQRLYEIFRATASG